MSRLRKFLIFFGLAEAPPRPVRLPHIVPAPKLPPLPQASRTEPVRAPSSVSPLDLYLKGGGEFPSDGVAALMAETERGRRRREAPTADCGPGASRLAPQYGPGRRAWVDSEKAGGYGGTEKEAAPDAAEVVEDQPKPIEVQFPPLPKSAEPGQGPTFVYDEPRYQRQRLRDDRPSLSSQRPVPPSRLADHDPLAAHTAPYVAGWSPGSTFGMPVYSDLPRTAPESTPCTPSSDSSTSATSSYSSDSAPSSSSTSSDCGGSSSYSSGGE